MQLVFQSGRRVLVGLVVGLCGVIGCTDAKPAGGSPGKAPTPVIGAADGAKTDKIVDKSAAEQPAEKDETLAERNKLSPEDRKLVDAQEWCVISDDARLGDMGPPIKLTINGETVFVCCKGCKKEAEAKADKTLAKLKELKAKKAAQDKKS